MFQTAKLKQRSRLGHSRAGEIGTHDWRLSARPSVGIDGGGAALIVGSISEPEINLL
jgi:hypothetical protein